MWREPSKKLNPRYVETTVKFGKGNVMVWGCFSSKGVGKLVFIDEIMDMWLYLDILRNNLWESASIMGLDHFIFQHDNDPKHSSKLVSEFLEVSEIEVLDWPSQSPDLNPIEHVWAYMKKELRGTNFKTKNDLKVELVRLWNSLPQGFIYKLVKSIPKRVKEVLKSNGKYTNY